MPAAPAVLPARMLTRPVERLAAFMAWLEPSLRKKVPPLALSTASRGALRSAEVPAALLVLPGEPRGEPRKTATVQREGVVGVGVGVGEGEGGALGEGVALGEDPGEGVALGVGEGDSVGHTMRRTAFPVPSTA